MQIGCRNCGVHWDEVEMYREDRGKGNETAYCSPCMAMFYREEKDRLIKEYGVDITSKGIAKRFCYPN